MLVAVLGMAVMYPEQELRFTRSHQASVFALWAAFFAGVALIGGGSGVQWAKGLELWGFFAGVVVCLALAVWCGWMARRCLRHAYLILSPVGIEIFPLFGVDQGMRVVPWAEVKMAEWKGKWLILHFTMEKTAGVQLSVTPLSEKNRHLLKIALEGRLPAGEAEEKSSDLSVEPTQP